MTTHKFYQLDVFTDRPLAGNPLAVFPDARDIDDKTMQHLAREMNLSETVFVTASQKATRRLRFFTPTNEIPLAGHPTIGTWWLLGELGELELSSSGTQRFTQETGSGVLPVDIRTENGQPVAVEMVQTPPQFGEIVAEREDLGNALGGDADTVLAAPSPQVVSTAIPQLMVPIKSLDALQTLPGNGGAQLATMLRNAGTDCAMCYSLETVNKDATVQCRMFAPGLGVPEDPATGSAAGALGSFLVRHGVVQPRNGIAAITVDQGIEMLRPSRIHTEIAVGNGGEITEVRVGGAAVTVITGEVTL